MANNTKPKMKPLPSLSAPKRPPRLWRARHKKWQYGSLLRKQRQKILRKSIETPHLVKIMVFFGFMYRRLLSTITLYFLQLGVDGDSMLV